MIVKGWNFMLLGFRYIQSIWKCQHYQHSKGHKSHFIAHKTLPHPSAWKGKWQSLQWGSWATRSSNAISPGYTGRPHLKSTQLYRQTNANNALSRLWHSKWGLDRNATYRDEQSVPMLIYIQAGRRRLVVKHCSDESSKHLPGKASSI